MAAAKKAQQEMYGALLTKREELVDTLEKKLTVMPETSRECVVILPDETQFTIPVQVSWSCVCVCVREREML